MTERRNTPRIEVSLNAIYYNENERSKIFHAKISNISTCGLLMETSQLLKLGSDLIVDIDAENIGRIVWVFGHVVRATEFAAAVEFTRIDQTNLYKLLGAEKLMASKIKSVIKPYRIKKEYSPFGGFSQASI